MGAVKLDDGQQAVSSAVEIADKVISKYEMMLDIIAKALTSIMTQDPVAKEMAKELKKGRAATAFIHSEDKGKVITELRKAGVKNFKVFDAVHSANGATLTGIAYSLDDSAAVMSVLAPYHGTCIDRKNGMPNAYMAIECGSVDIHEFIDYSKNMNRVFKKDVDVTQAMIIGKLGHDIGVPLFIDGPSNGNYTVRYADRDINEMERIKRETAKIMASPLMPKIADTLDWEVSNVKDINDKVISDNSNEIEEGTVIADESGRQMTFERNNVIVEYPEGTFKNTSGEYFQQSGISVNPDGSARMAIRRNMNDSENRSRITNELLKMKNPAMMEPDKAREYSRLTSSKGKRDFVIDRNREKGRPSLNENEIKILKEDQRVNHIIEEKLSQNNPHQYVKQVSPFNIAQDFWGFKQDERVNAMAEHDHDEQSYDNPDYYDDARAEDFDMHNADFGDRAKEQASRAEDEYYAFDDKADTTDLTTLATLYDEVEERGEDEPRTPYGPSFGYDDIQYGLNDLNNNNIPDDFEMPEDDR